MTNKMPLMPEASGALILYLLLFNYCFSGCVDCLSGADQSAQMTSYAFAADQYRFAGFFVKFEGLMAAVHARYIASAASVAKVIIEYREQYGISFDTVMIDYRACCTAYEILKRCYALAFHIDLKTFDQIIDQPVTVLHYSSGYLQASGAEKYELKRIVPGLYSSHAAYVHVIKLFASGQVRDESQRYRLYRITGVAADDGFAPYGRLCHERINIYACDGVDRIDGRYTVSSSAL